MIFIALGANLPSAAGAPADTLHAALAMLSDNGVRLDAVSAFYRTPAWPDSRDPDFVNAVARVETSLSPAALMDVLHQVEAHFGRRRTGKNTPRTLDLDLLDYDGRVEAGPPELPHPRLSERGFVLLPLRDIMPKWRHPGSGIALEKLIAALSLDTRDVIKRLA